MSVEIKLEAKGGAEQRILEYLQANASEALAEKINAGNKTLAGAWRYVEGEARKELGGKSGCVEDAKVFGWVIHYFEEKDEGKGLKAEEKKTPNTEHRTPNVEPKKIEKKTAAPAMTDFEKLFGGEN